MQLGTDDQSGPMEGVPSQERNGRNGHPDRESPSGSDPKINAAPDTALELRNVTKSYGTFLALDNVSLSVRTGEVVGLIGENGAGKSTLLNLVCGVVRPDAGELYVRGEPYAPHSYKDAMARGVFRVYQEPAFVPVLTVRENMVLGLERRFVRRGLLSGRQVDAAVSEALQPLEGLVDLNSPISACDRNTQQAIEILRALLASRVLGTSHPIILLDEPTASLVGHDLTILFDTLERLRGAASFVFVSHRLSEINDHCDRAYVLKDGKLTSEVAAGTSEAELHRLMVGRERSEDYYLEGEQGGPGAERLLVVDELTGDGFHEVSLAVNAGEIVGIAGVVGSGKEQLGRAIAGLAKTRRGRVIVTGKDGTQRLPAPGHVGYVPSDRQAEGAMELFSVARNISMSSLAAPPLRRGPFVSRAREREVARQWVQRLSIRTSSIDTPMRDLSGGNQQKVVLSRVLQTGVRVLVLDNPARGIDAGAKADLYRLLRTLAAEGHGIVLIADELPEVIGLSTRVLVMKDGRVRRSFDADPHDKPLEPTLISEMV